MSDEVSRRAREDELDAEWAAKKAARDEFREDNEPTARHYLTEWFSRAMDAEMELRRYRPMTPTLLSEIRKADD